MTSSWETRPTKPFSKKHYRKKTKQNHSSFTPHLTVGFWKHLENKVPYKQHYPGIPSFFRKLYLEVPAWVSICHIFVESQNCKRNPPDLLRSIYWHLKRFKIPVLRLHLLLLMHMDRWEGKKWGIFILS